MIKPTEKNYKKLIDLFCQNPKLFKSINPSLKKYVDGPELLYCDGEADIIQIKGKFYRFFWEEAEEFGIVE